MIDAIGVADQGIAEAAQIEQTIPVGVVAGEPGHLETEDDADVAEGDLGGESAEAAAGGNRSRDLDRLMDDDLLDPLADFDELRPAGGRVPFDLPPLRPAIGVVVMIDVAKQKARLCPVDDQADKQIRDVYPHASVCPSARCG